MDLNPEKATMEASHSRGEPPPFSSGGAPRGRSDNEIKDDKDDESELINSFFLPGGILDPEAIDDNQRVAIGGGAPIESPSRDTFFLPQVQPAWAASPPVLASSSIHFLQDQSDVLLHGQNHQVSRTHNDPSDSLFSYLNTPSGESGVPLRTSADPEISWLRTSLQPEASLPVNAISRLPSSLHGTTTDYPSYSSSSALSPKPLLGDVSGCSLGSQNLLPASDDVASTLQQNEKVNNTGMLPPPGFGCIAPPLTTPANLSTEQDDDEIVPPRRLWDSLPLHDVERVAATAENKHSDVVLESLTVESIAEIIGDIRLSADTTVEVLPDIWRTKVTDEVQAAEAFLEEDCMVMNVATKAFGCVSEPPAMGLGVDKTTGSSDRLVTEPIDESIPLGSEPMPLKDSHPSAIRQSLDVAEKTPKSSAINRVASPGARQKRAKSHPQGVTAHRGGEPVAASPEGRGVVLSTFLLNALEMFNGLIRWMSEIFFPAITQTILSFTSLSSGVPKASRLVGTALFNVHAYVMESGAPSQTDEVVVIALAEAPFFSEFLMTSFSLPRFVPHLIAYTLLLYLCRLPLHVSQSTGSSAPTSNLFGSGNRSNKDCIPSDFATRFCHATLNCIQASLPVLCFLEGFENRQPSFLLLSRGERLLVFHLIRIVRESLLFSPVIWIGMITQLMIVRWLTPSHVMVEILVFHCILVIEVASIRLVHNLKPVR